MRFVSKGHGKILSSALLALPLILAGSATCILVLLGACTMMGGCPMPSESGAAMPSQPKESPDRSLSPVPMLAIAPLTLGGILIAAGAGLLAARQRHTERHVHRPLAARDPHLLESSDERPARSGRISSRKDRFSIGFAAGAGPARLLV